MKLIELELDCDEAEQRETDAAPERTTFAARLAVFISHAGMDPAHRITSLGSRMPLRVMTRIGPFHGPKPHWKIRELLEHIQQLVRNN